MRGSELNGSKVNDGSIDLATDKESLVVCQTFRSGNTQLVTIVGKDELMRLRAAIDEALQVGTGITEPHPEEMAGWFTMGNRRTTGTTA